MRHVVLILSVLSAGGLWSLAAPPETPPPEAEPSETEPSETAPPEGAPPEAPPNANLPSFELTRGERPITVQQTALDEEGGIAVTRGGSSCRDDENISFFYAPDPKRIDTTVDNTRIRSSIVFRSQPKEGGAEAQDRALKRRAGELGVSEAEVVRRALARALGEDSGSPLAGRRHELLTALFEDADRAARTHRLPEGYTFDREALYEDDRRFTRWDE